MAAIVFALAAVIAAVPVPVLGTDASTGALGIRPSAGSSAPIVVRIRPCPDSEFTCITLRLPRDHFHRISGGTFDVTFALHRASKKPRRGVFVTVTGGPGTSGLAAADPYTSFFDPRIPEHYDMVFFDQRGIGMSEPLQCPDATLDFYSSPAVPTVSTAAARAFASAAKTYAADCVAETGEDPTALPYFSTAQAVEDLDAFRAWLGADKIDLYGESYGTQFAQQYAAAHPANVRSLTLDGPVDLTLTGTEYYSEDARAFDSTLAMTLNRCTHDTVCHREVVGGNALADYDALAAHLRGRPTAYSFIKADGSVERRTFGLGDLETAAAGFVYGTYDRMLFQRALAQASQGNILPLARLAYLSLGQDPETLAAIPDPTYSDAMYYAVECMDYDYRTGSPDESGEAYLAAGVAAGVASVRLGSVFYGDLPCAYWPAAPSTSARPGYLTDTAFPVFVLASTTDPATPYPGALRIFSHLTNGYLVVEPGGPHVIFGRGNACEDAALTAFLVRGALPARRRTFCDFVGTEPYVGIPEAAGDDYRGAAGALAAMSDVDDELNNNGDYWYWEGVEPLVFGCLDGGWARYTPYADGYRVALHACAFSNGLPLTGRATINTAEGSVKISVSAPGGTDLRYVDDPDGNRSVRGTFHGRHVSAHD